MRILFTLLLSALMARAATVTITWDASAGATGYNLYEQVNTNWIRVVNTAAPPVVFTNLNLAVPHTWVVTATNATGESGFSGQATLQPIPNPPTNVTVRISMILKHSPVIDGVYTNLSIAAFPPFPDLPGYFQGTLLITRTSDPADLPSALRRPPPLPPR